MSAIPMGDPRGSPWPRYVILAAVSILMLYPLVWLIGATFKSNAEIFTQMSTQDAFAEFLTLPLYEEI